MIDNLIEVTLSDPDAFLKVKETLTRIGIASFKEKKLYQSCHILHKRGKYYITHFKELFALDGKVSTMTDDDVARRNVIANLLNEWGLVKIVNGSLVKADLDTSSVKIVPYKDKHNWVLESKYTIGNK